MNATISQFIHSDAGLITGWVLLLMGAGDLLFAWRVLPKHPEITQFPGFRKYFTPALFFSIFLTLLGIYILWGHG